LNEIVFSSLERQITSQSGFFKKWLKLALRFFPKSFKSFRTKNGCHKHYAIFNTTRLINLSKNAQHSTLEASTQFTHPFAEAEGCCL
jgi:hypothetical protein